MKRDEAGDASDIDLLVEFEEDAHVGLFRFIDLKLFLESVDRIGKYIQGMSFADFSADDKTVEAVVYNLVMVGEAAGHIPKEIVAAHADVPWEKMRGMRNVIVHTYFGV